MGAGTDDAGFTDPTAAANLAGNLARDASMHGSWWQFKINGLVERAKKEEMRRTRTRNFNFKPQDDTKGYRVHFLSRHVVANSCSMQGMKKGMVT
ncbi:MAG: hypothetical protein GYA24_24195 [Candidatus Lokiarchaeota archaeon]|nr:hypothetical protein [Candidatus Lokiarchaeota archaeon]